MTPGRPAPSGLPFHQDRSKLEERIGKMVRRWPKVSGYHLNPDEMVVQGITQALVQSAMDHGFNYCP